MPVSNCGAAAAEHFPRLLVQASCGLCISPSSMGPSTPFPAYSTQTLSPGVTQFSTCTGTGESSPRVLQGSVTQHACTGPLPRALDLELLPGVGVSPHLQGPCHPRHPRGCLCCLFSPSCFRLGEEAPRFAPPHPPLARKGTPPSQPSQSLPGLGGRGCGGEDNALPCHSES